MRVHSNERTKIAYDGTPEASGPLPEGASPRVVLEFGVNEVSDADMLTLSRDVNFKRHEDAGFVHVLNNDGVAVAPEAVADEVAAKPKGKKSPPPAAPLPPDQQKVVDDFYALDEAGRSVMYPAHTDAEKLLIDADPRAVKAPA